MGNKHSHSGHKSKSKYSTYSIPPNAVRPSPPGQPQIEVEDETSVFVHWDAPNNNGGCPIMGYLVQHSELDERLWHTPNPPMTENHCWIINLKPGAVYVFRVIAENILGYSGPSQLSEPTKLTIQMEPPKFIQELESVNALQHERVEFKARLAPGAPCHMTWFLDNVQVFPDDDHAGVELRGNSLLITKVEADCEVKCLVENEYGASESVAMLVVGVPPRIKEEPHAEHFFRVGEIIRIKFSYSGTPTPTVHWFHDGHLLPDSQFQALSNMTILKISNASRKHRGEYMLRIENTLGQDSSFALVTVADKPSPPTKPTVVLMSDNSCLIEWSDGEDDGGCPVTSHSVEYFRSGWDVWLAGTCTRTRSAKIRDLIPGSKYIFRVKAENPYGQSDPSESSTQLFIPDLSSTTGLMSTVDEIEEEDAKSEEPTFSEEKTRILVPQANNRDRGNSPARSPTNPSRFSTLTPDNRDNLNARSRSPVNPSKASLFDYRDCPEPRSRSPVNPARIPTPDNRNDMSTRSVSPARNSVQDKPLDTNSNSLSATYNRDGPYSRSRSPVIPARTSALDCRDRSPARISAPGSGNHDQPNSRSRSPVNPARIPAPDNLNDPNTRSASITKPDMREDPSLRSRSPGPVISAASNRDGPYSRSRSPVNPARILVFDYRDRSPARIGAPGSENARSRSPVNPTKTLIPENLDDPYTRARSPVNPTKSSIPENRDDSYTRSRSPVNPTRTSVLGPNNRSDPNLRSRSPVNPTRVSTLEADREGPNPRPYSPANRVTTREIPKPGRPDYPSRTKPITPEPPYKPLTLFDQYSTPTRSSTLPRLSPNPTERHYGSSSSLTVSSGTVRGTDSPSPDEEGRRLSNYSARSQTSLDSVRSHSAASSSSHLIFEEDSEGEEGVEQVVTTSSLTLFKTGQTVRIRTASREELPLNSRDVSPSPVTPPVFTTPPLFSTLTSPFLPKKEVTGRIDILKLTVDVKTKKDSPEKEETKESTPPSKDGVEVVEKTPWSEWVLDWLWLPFFIAMFVKYLNLGVSVVSVIYVLYRLFRINQ